MTKITDAAAKFGIRGLSTHPTEVAHLHAVLGSIKDTAFSYDGEQVNQINPFTATAYTTNNFTMTFKGRSNSKQGVLDSVAITSNVTGELVIEGTYGLLGGYFDGTFNIEFKPGNLFYLSAVIQGNAFNNVLGAVEPSKNSLDGGGGIDTAVFGGPRAAYSVNKTIQGFEVVSSRDGDSDHIRNVERVQFSDSILALDVNGNAGQAYRLYQAAFDRTPDTAGLAFQIRTLDSGATLKSVASNFLDSPEFSSRYGALNDNAFVTALYQNVLHRTPDAAGFAYQQNALRTGTDRAQLLVNFSESPENQAALIGVIGNGIVYA